MKYLSGPPLYSGSCFKYETNLARLASDKYSSLIGPFVDEKVFYKMITADKIKLFVTFGNEKSASLFVPSKFFKLVHLVFGK